MRKNVKHIKDTNQADHHGHISEENVFRRGFPDMSFRRDSRGIITLNDLVVGQDVTIENVRS